MRLSVTQLRIAILILNFLLTLGIGAQAIYGVVHQPAMPIRQNRSLNPADLKYLGGLVSTGSSAPVKVRDFGRRMVPPPPPPPAATQKAEKAPEPGPVGSGELPPGPLDSTWEYVHCIINLVDPNLSRATLQRKDPVGGTPSSKKPISSRPRVIRTPPTPGRTPRTAIPGIVPSTDKKTLRPKDHWVEEEPGIDVWVIAVTRAEFIYQDAKQPGRTFALVRKPDSIYQEGPNGTSTLKKSPEAEDPNNPGGKADKKGNFLVIPPDRDKAFEDRHLRPPSGAPPDLSQKTSASSPAPGAKGPGARPLSKEEELKQAQDMLKGLEKNKEFLKTPKAERDKLKQLLGGKK